MVLTPKKAAAILFGCAIMEVRRKHSDAPISEEFREPFWRNHAAHGDPDERDIAALVVDLPHEPDGTISKRVGDDLRIALWKMIMFHAWGVETTEWSCSMLAYALGGDPRHYFDTWGYEPGRDVVPLEDDQPDFGGSSFLDS